MDDFLIDEFYCRAACVDFCVYGVLDRRNHIHTLGTDSKIIGRIFEIMTQPILEDIARKHKLVLTTPTSQTRYPDFVMMSDAFSTQKIAIDVKSTYIAD